MNGFLTKHAININIREEVHAVTWFGTYYLLISVSESVIRGKILLTHNTGELAPAMWSSLPCSMCISLKLYFYADVRTHVIFVSVAPFDVQLITLFWVDVHDKKYFKIRASIHSNT